MLLINVITLIVFCLLLGAHIWWRPFLERNRGLVLIGIIIAILLTLTINSYFDYKTISLSGPPTKYLVPPYVPAAEYAQTLFLRVFAPYTFSAILAIFALLIATKINFFKERLFATEPLYIASVIFLMRHPFWIPYLASLLALAILAAIYGTIKNGKEYRFSLYHLWLASGIVAVLIFPWLSKIPFFNLIGFPNLY